MEFWEPFITLLLLAFALLFGVALTFGGTGYEPQHAREKHPPSRHRSPDTGREVRRGGIAELST